MTIFHLSRLVTNRFLIRRFIPLTACMLALTTAWSAEPTPVPKPVASVLNAAQSANNDQAALEALATYKGEPHAFIEVARGRIYLTSNDLPKAQAAFDKALSLQPDLREAHLGAATVATRKQEWPKALLHCGQVIDPNTAEQGDLRFYAQVAVQARDWRVAELITEHGLLRFPTDDEFRRLDLSILLASQQFEAAQQAALTCLQRDPSQEAVWQQLAISAQRSKDPDQAIAALELAVLTQPTNTERRYHLAAFQAQRQFYPAAAATILPLQTVTPAQPRVVALALEIAFELQNDADFSAWLALLPVEQRTRDIVILSARWAVRSQDLTGMHDALAILTAHGDADPSVLAWAAQASEQLHDDATAEALYLQVMASDHPIAAAAHVRLINLLLRQQRLDEASTSCATYVAQHPDDLGMKQVFESIRGQLTLPQ